MFHRSVNNLYPIDPCRLYLTSVYVISFTMINDSPTNVHVLIYIDLKSRSNGAHILSS